MSSTALLYAQHPNGEAEWLHGLHVSLNYYQIKSLPLLGTGYAYDDIVRVGVSRNSLYIAEIRVSSPYRIVRFQHGRIDDPRFRVRAVQMHHLGCIIEYTNQGYGSIAYQADATMRLGRLLRQMEHERLLALRDDVDPLLRYEMEGVA
jgi:hypothetical protein